MSSLIRRGLVSKAGNPPRYSLTEAGAILTVRLLEGSTAITRERAHSETPIVAAPEAVSGSVDEGDAAESGVMDSQDATSMDDFMEIRTNHCLDEMKSKFQFWYVTPEGQLVTRKDLAAVSFNGNISVGFLMKCIRSRLESSYLAYTLDDTRNPDGDMVYAFLSNKDAPEICDPPTEDSNSFDGPKYLSLEEHIVIGSDDSSAEEIPPLSVRLGFCSGYAENDCKESGKDAPPIQDAPDNRKILMPDQRGGGSLLLKGNKTVAQGNSIVASDEGPPCPDKGTFEKCTTSTTVPQTVSTQLGPPIFVLKPGQYEVVLCVDSSESSSNRKSASHFRGVLLQELAKNGIRFDVRRLSVGDFVWIAKEIVSPQPGQLSLPQSLEIVLEHVVERKRLDDLAGSICDGRFHEQKFRLATCGVRHPVYLVEDYSNHSHLQLDVKSLEQAITNTQVIDRFFVKRTKDLSDSVTYLTLFTRLIQKHYSNKTLKAYPLETVLSLGKEREEPLTLYSLSFEDFNEGSAKSKALTTYEMFAKQVMQIPGMSAEKTHAVLEKYPTISHLREAYKLCLNDEERENLISNIRSGQARRRLGPSISRLFCSLYWRC